MSLRVVHLIASTNGAYDASTAVNLLGLVVCVERALPFQLGAIVQVVESVRHTVGIAIFGLLIRR